MWRTRTARSALALGLAAGLLACQRLALAGNIAATKHNLSASGPGPNTSSETTQICVFCHAPHNSIASRALWNQEMAPYTYTPYTSSTLRSQPGQPTGSSRLCLSCHDGTTALGSLRAPPSGVSVTMPPLAGAANLGTDLSDDHPISFVYDTALASQNPELADPAGLPPSVRLDRAQQLQCTACHDPHSSTYRKFLRMEDRFGALCVTCHNVKHWSDSSHATSGATGSSGGGGPWPDSGYSTVGETGCQNCHQPHGAAEPSRLLASSQDAQVCLRCHDGSVASKNVEPELLKVSAHPVNSSNGLHEPQEDFTTMLRHATCVDCHNPHQVEPSPAAPPGVPGRLKGVRGVDLDGVPVSEARYEYEVCFKCHSQVREAFNPSNPSYHPVAAVGKNPSVVSLLPGYTPSSIIGCTDCHNNDEWTSGGSAPKGPHGSRYPALLERQYIMGGSASPYAFQLYAMCYKCHTEIVRSPGTGAFPHGLHVQEIGATCNTCHNPHGSREHEGLISFLPGMVSPNDNGVFAVFFSGGHGQCALKCHSYSHEDSSF